MTFIFHDLLGIALEIYIDNYGLKMSPLKRILGFIIDPKKVEIHIKFSCAFQIKVCFIHYLLLSTCTCHVLMFLMHEFSTIVWILLRKWILSAFLMYPEARMIEIVAMGEILLFVLWTEAITIKNMTHKELISFVEAKKVA
ncbi:hypothetical protein ACJX0J_007939 [Zea mays]